MYAVEYRWILAFAPLPMLIWLILRPYKEERASVRFSFFDELAAAAGLKPAEGAIVPRASWLQKLLAPVCWALLLLAAARPVFIEPPIQRIQPARDLMLALDISQSMESRDFISPQGQRITRIEAVKRVVDGFIERRRGDRIGLIVFGSAAYPQVPFTLDHRTCRVLLEETEAGMAGPQTMIGDAIGLAIREFERSEAHERVLILLTDGNDTGSRVPPVKAAEIAKDRSITIHTVAIGDPNATGDDKVDVALMRSISATTGGRFFLGQDEKQLAAVYTALDAIIPQNFKTQSYRPKRQLFMYPLGAAVLLVLVFQMAMLGWTFAVRRLARRNSFDAAGEARRSPT